ncbi:MAG: hypothetical protein SWH78_03700 [Thermodesulfobacteriota bacterium]|nr:hypothetical protein [Thermodesulfobacteriota bacterium]
MQTRGAIYHHRQLVFHNGFVGKKYLILLNTPGKNEPYLFVKTTSQKKDKATTPGCIKKRSLFFIPAGKTFFKLDTWVQLFEIYAIPAEDIDTNKDITVEGSLGVKMIDDIVNCLFEAEEENISPIHKNPLRRPFQESLLKLKEKFGKS